MLSVVWRLLASSCVLIVLLAIGLYTKWKFKNGGHAHPHKTIEITHVAKRLGYLSTLSEA